MQHVKTHDALGGCLALDVVYCFAQQGTCNPCTRAYYTGTKLTARARLSVAPKATIPGHRLAIQISPPGLERESIARHQLVYVLRGETIFHLQVLPQSELIGTRAVLVTMPSPHSSMHDT